MGGRGKREYVQVLRLMENFRKEEVHEGVCDVLCPLLRWLLAWWKSDRLAISFDAIKHLVLCRIDAGAGDGRPQRLDLELYPHLPRVNVTKRRRGHRGHRPGRAMYHDEPAAMKPERAGMDFGIEVGFKAIKSVGWQ